MNGLQDISTFPGMLVLFGDHQLKENIRVKSVFEPSGWSDRRVSPASVVLIGYGILLLLPGMLVLFDDHQLKESIMVKFVFEPSARSD